MSTPLKWQQGDPNFDGIYLVALRCPNGLGVHDLLHWHEGAWMTIETEEVVPDTYKMVGYVSAANFVSAFAGSWPSWDED